MATLDQPRFAREAWIPLLAGIAWLWMGAADGFIGFLFAAAPGLLLLTSGGAWLLWPGDPRMQQTAALGGVVGVLFSLPALLPLSFAGVIVLAALSAVSFVAAGTASLRREEVVDEVPAPRPTLGLAAKVAGDDALLGMMGLAVPILGGADARVIAREAEEARELFEARGWLEKPTEYHAQPLPLEAPRIAQESTRGRGGTISFEHLSFESEYEPRSEEPGRGRWLSYAANRTAHAWVLRHRSGPRPWLVCIHGYQMGSPLIDLGAFEPRFFHEKLGLNLVVPTLPLHGRRKHGRISGDGYLSGSLLDTVHAEAQAMWDIRRLLSWVRAQGAPAVGVHGLSLGGYNTALLASLDDDLACAIPGIPAVDFGRLLWEHMSESQVRDMENAGLTRKLANEVLRVVSPLAVEPKVPHAHRAIFGGVADRLVPAEQVRDLWLHWQKPEIVWYQGAHITFMLDPRVRELVERTVRGAGLAA